MPTLTHVYSYGTLVRVVNTFPILSHSSLHLIVVAPDAAQNLIRLEINHLVFTGIGLLTKE